MVAYIGLGSNLGHRLQNLEWAAKQVIQMGFPILKVSPIYETPALLPPKALEGWNRPFLNAVLKIQCHQQTPEQLLFLLKKIENQMRREDSTKWAPRVIDLDILLFNKEIVYSSELRIPHPELIHRNFVLTPLKELEPSLIIPPIGYYKEKSIKKSYTALEYFRLLKSKLPTWMHILNVTPDSFSDGGELHLSKFVSILRKISDNYIHIIDLGAESTRPGAIPISSEEEWQRLRPYVELFFRFYKDKIFRPKLSVDTRYIKTARKALDKGVDIINDVSGLSNGMIDLLKSTEAEYILMHSITVPADRTKTLPMNKDPVNEIKKWLKEKVSILKKENILLDRVIFDPGIGFGKTADQSLEILKRIHEFYCFPLRVAVGHSRKSFMKLFSSDKPKERDPESAGISVSLVEKGVDILRVHETDFHARVMKGFLS
ncbi:MAG: dihydropteroate synthase [Bdellovibrionales bacterium]|nr:dihydropteroate synthase [Bdellovibrionales bacterium]